MVEVADVNDVGAHVVEHRRETAVDARVAVAVAAARVVDEVQRDARVVGVLLSVHREVRREGVLLAGEDVDLVARGGEAVTEGLRVDLGPGVVSAWGTQRSRARSTAGLPRGAGAGPGGGRRTRGAADVGGGGGGGGRVGGAGGGGARRTSCRRREEQGVGGGRGRGGK